PMNGGGSTSKLKLKPKTAPTTPTNQMARAQHVLTQAQTFIETADSEVYSVDIAMKNIRSALDSFQMILEKQLHLCSDCDGLNVSRLKADLMDTLENVKTSSSTIEQTSQRLQKTLTSGKKYVQSHSATLNRQKRAGCGVEIPSLFETNTITSTSAYTLKDILFTSNPNHAICRENISAILEKLAIKGHSVISKKELLLIYRELLNWSLIHNPTISALDRAQQKAHTTRYASILTAASWEQFEAETGELPSLPIEILETYLLSNAFYTLVTSVSDKLGAPSPPKGLMTPSKETHTVQLSAAEQTLSMAKMLHDLATAEAEAKTGYRLSVRTNAARSKEFSKAFLSASKELLEKETSFY
ncbi:hypothetical protein THRCLA_22329, partial [Thraustotheca clavata]